MIEHAFLRRCVAMGVLLALCACLMAQAQPKAKPKGKSTAKSVGNWFTGVPQIRAAYFHVQFLQAENFATNESKATQDGIQTLIRTFRDDIDDFTDNDTNFKELAVARFSSAVVKNLDEVSANIAALENTARGIAQKSGNAPVVLIYVLAHGYDDRGVIKLELSAGTRVTRDQVKAEAEKLRSPRLVVFITDNCSEKVAPAKASPPPKLGGVWRALYFGHQGFVDIQTSSPNQFAFVAESGSVFLSGLNNALFPGSVSGLDGDIESKVRQQRLDARAAYAKHFDKDGDKVVSWNELRGHIRDQVEKSASEVRDKLPAASPVKELMKGGQTILIDTSRVKVRPAQ